MSQNVREIIQSSANYKQLTLDKTINKKRGRASIRREKRGGNIYNRVIRDTLAASFASKEYRKEVKQFEKTVSEAAGRGIFDIPMPEYIAELKEAAQLAEGNLKQAHIAKQCMEEYPPLI